MRLKGPRRGGEIGGTRKACHIGVSRRINRYAIARIAATSAEIGGIG